MPIRWRTSLPGLLVGDGRVGEHVEDLVEQPATVGLGLGAVDQPLREFVTGSGVRAGECLVEQLHQLVEHLDVGFGQRRQQDRVAPVDVGALQRLVGGGGPISASIRRRPAGMPGRARP